MVSVPGELESDDVQLVWKIVAPFFVINLCASVVFLLWPVAIPIFCAEFCLLAAWAAWGPGEFWKRFVRCLSVGTLFFLSQVYLIVVTFVVTSNASVAIVMVQWLFSAWIIAQIPLWALRYIWQWRITLNASDDLGRFSVNDNMIGITMICVAFASCRWATDFFIDSFAEFEFDKALSFYGWALFEFYLLIGITAFGTYLAFRLNKLSNQIIPLVVVSGVFAMISGWVWVPNSDRWIAIGILWVGAIMFSWSVILPITYLKKMGYRLFIGQIPV
jgi:hypothetical protein